VLRWVVAPAMAIVAVLASTVASPSRPASADSVASAKARAKALEAELQTVGNQISAVSQQYDAAVIKANQLQNRITVDKAARLRDARSVSRYQASLQQAAVNAYVNVGAVASTNPLFAPNADALGATAIYNQVAEGNLAGSVAGFTNAREALGRVVANLNAAKAAATQESSYLRNEQAHLTALSSTVRSDLAAANEDVKNQLAILRAQQLAAANASFQQTSPSVPNQSFPAPPPDSRANIAVDTALSFLGIPYCWGGASRSCVDCSGLTMLSWGAAGVSLPHYSGAQMADSTPVPINDLMPGDLLFYGPGGSEHVAMYVGHGTMIEAPYTGAVVWLTPVRLGYGFAGAGRP
jgi:peptidoglycan DL-endopeptidase CwlO